jgi:hypothetical protein
LCTAQVRFTPLITYVSGARSGTPEITSNSGGHRGNPFIIVGASLTGIAIDTPLASFNASDCQL